MSDRQTLARATGIPHEKAESLATATARFVEGSAATKADLERTEAGPRSRPTSTASNSALKPEIVRLQQDVTMRGIAGLIAAAASCLPHCTSGRRTADDRRRR